VRTWKPSIQSLFGLLGQQRPPRDLDDAIADIQDIMLEALGEAGAKTFPKVARRIMYAPDLQALWYLRGDLMAALAAMHGEMAARKTISSITAQFHGLLPNSLTSRASPLVG